MDCKLLLAVACGLVIALFVRYWRRKKRDTSSSMTKCGTMETFTASVPSPPPLGAAADQRTIDTTTDPVATSAIGVPDTGAYTSTANNTDPRPLPTPDPGAPVGYDSMFDTKIRPAWDTEPPTPGLPLDGTAIKLPKQVPVTTSNKKATPPSSEKKQANQKNALFTIDSRGMPSFSSLVACDQENYQRSQNFYEYNYNYPLIPDGDKLGPVAANIGSLPLLSAPGVDYQIVSGNKDGGAPLPNGTYFSQ